MSIIRFVYLTVVLLSALIVSPRSPHASLNMIEVNRIFGEDANDVAVEDGIAYLASGTHLEVMDVSDPSAPRFLGNVELPPPVLGVAVKNGILYVASWTGGVQILDVSNPISPVWLATWPITAIDVQWHDDRLYVCGGHEGLSILDVTTPASPQLVSTYHRDNFYVADLEVSGSTAYLGASYFSGDAPQPIVLIVDVQSAPPRLLGQCGAPISAGAFTVALGPYLYASAGTGFFTKGYIFDVSDPQNPVSIKSFTIDNGAEDLEYVNGYLHAFTHRGLRTFDVRSPESMFLAQTIDIPDANRATVIGNLIYYASGVFGLNTLKLESDGTAARLGAADQLSYSRRLTRHGSRVYASGEKLWIIDVTDPDAPAVTGKVNQGGFRTEVRGNYLYLAGFTQGLVVLDITDPEAPVIVTTLPGNRVLDVRVQGNFLYTVESRQGLRVYDLTDPDHPAPRGFAPILAQPEVLAVSAGYAYVTDLASDLYIVDVSDPDVPTLVRTMPGVFEEIEVVDDRLYSASGDDGLKIYHLLDPVNPSLIGTHGFATYSSGLDVALPFVYMANGPGGLSVIDASDPADLFEVANHEVATDTKVLDVLAIGDRVISAEQFGLGFYKLTGTSVVREPTPGPVALYASPNPFRATTALHFQLEVSGPARLSIHDAAGRLARNWSMTAPAGLNTVTWDGRDGTGRELPAGVYFLRIDTEAGSARRTVVRIPPGR